MLQALNSSQLDRAVELADQALLAGVEHPLFLNLMAFEMERRGRPDAAAALLHRALALAPDDILILTALGRIYSQIGRSAEALACFDAALGIHPDHAPAHHERGLALSALGQDDEARPAQERAMALDPNHPGPPAALAGFAVRDKDEAAARSLATRALALDPGEPTAGMVMASLSAAAGDHQGAVDRVSGLLGGALTPLHRAAALQILGEELEQLGRPEDGIKAIIDGASILHNIHAPLYAASGAETGLQLCARLEDYFGTAMPNDWGPAARDDDGEAKGLVFLFGFVRSGTTLLEQVLASHPDVVALEEQATLRAVASSYFDTADHLDHLARLTADEAAALRADYWRRVRSFGVEPKGKVFVDKAPLSTIWLPMVAKLFPSAKVLFAVRDPRDVVISAFRHRFVVNALALPFTDLVESAEFYAAVMRLAAIYRRTCALDLYQHRHEDLVADFDAEVGRICDFLGLEWSDSLRDFAETAKRRDVRTPSAEQVRRGLSSEGVGRWRRYGAVVDPILPILKPWVEAYGYAS